MIANKLSHLSWRSAIKLYDTKKKVSDEQIAILLEAARVAPTSYGLQPIKLYLVSNEKIKKQLRESGFNQPQFTDASHIIVLAARNTIERKDIDDYISRIATQRGILIEELKDFKAMLLNSIANKTKDQLHDWAVRQAYIVLGILLDVAAYNKIDTTPMEGFDNSEFDKILNIKKEGFESVVVLALGFRSKNDKYSKLKKVRKDSHEFVSVIK